MTADNYKPNDIKKENKESADATAHAAAVAYNKNYNILYYPSFDSSGPAREREDDGSEKLSPEDFISSFLGHDDKDENEAVAKAEGKAIIKNKNINVVVSL